MTYHIQTNALVVKPIDEPLSSEQSSIVRIDDDGAGLFVVVEQHGRIDLSKIAIDVDEWPTLRRAIDQMIKLCELANQ